MKEGCRDALVLWGDILIDGHNRYELCSKHNIPYKTVQREFKSRDDVIEWIILNQFGRRNLPAHERARLALRLKPVIAEKAKENKVEAANKMNANVGNNVSTEICENVKPIDTQKELAKIAGVSHDTIAKVEHIEQKETVVFECEHNVDDCSKDIKAADAIVRRYRYKGHWYPGKQATVKEKLDSFISYVNNPFRKN